jgi:hypothetical protein
MRLESIEITESLVLGFGRTNSLVFRYDCPSTFFKTIHAAAIIAVSLNSSVGVPGASECWPVLGYQWAVHGFLYAFV